MDSVLKGRARLLQCDNILPQIMLHRNNYLNAMRGRKSEGAKVPENEPARLTAGTRAPKLALPWHGIGAGISPPGKGV